MYIGLFIKVSVLRLRAQYNKERTIFFHSIFLLQDSFFSEHFRLLTVCKIHRICMKQSQTVHTLP